MHQTYLSASLRHICYLQVTKVKGIMVPNYFSFRLLKWGKIQVTKVKITDSPEQLKSVI